jgi:hypothetical protein
MFPSSDGIYPIRKKASLQDLLALTNLTASLGMPKRSLLPSQYPKAYAMT